MELCNRTFYPNNWQEKLTTVSELRYLQLSEIKRHGLAHIYKYRNEIESLQKIGAATLANEIIFDGYRNAFGLYFHKIDMRVIIKKWLKTNKQKLKTINPTFHEFMLEKTLKERNAPMINETEKYIHHLQIKQLPKEVNLTKFRKWFIWRGECFGYYVDHLHMLGELNTPFNDDSVLYPEDLRVVHDNAVNTLNLLKGEIEERQYQERKNQIKALEVEIDNLLFLTPHSLQEIIQEGNILRHCMDSQHCIERHIQGRTTIVFTQRKEEPDMPYFTLGYRN